ncbi:MAG TPA: TetR/AcrR family transcriptional regulator [Deltaproteobacteria bacterium]|nr:TetR/AcrR family transcriptional regulator [Deltaproteobacteria bacterium]HQI81542.1 TetR/AcrR family transcriptional regulator [Deltaproteobacteria bacterium]
MQARKGHKNPETLDRILAAAKDEFADKGFAGARMDAIARRAKVNKATIYYHIGDKKALYAMVIHDIIGTASLSLSDSVKDLATPEEKIRTYIAILARTFDENPQMPRIMMREIASGGRDIPDVFFQDLSAILATLTSIIEEGAAAGRFTPSHPLLVHFMTLGATIIYKIFASVLLAGRQSPDGLPELRPMVSGTVTEEIERLILKALGT